jgi:hypothetical protein
MTNGNGIIIRHISLGTILGAVLTLLGLSVGYFQCREYTLHCSFVKDAVAANVPEIHAKIQGDSLAVCYKRVDNLEKSETKKDTTLEDIKNLLDAMATNDQKLKASQKRKSFYWR